jgi:uncharacterized repeat protein (TIGR02543 family)
MTSAYLLTSNDDISSSDRNSRISYNLNAGVTYYIGAGAYSNGAATYILTISGTAATVTYTVSYSANGGSGAPASQTKTQNVSLTLSSVRPTRSGYTFLGWSTSSAAASASYQPGGSYTANAGITLYAVWQTATAASAITAIGTGSRTVSVVAGTPTRFAFTPSTTGTYTFSTSSNSGDPKLYLYSNSAMTSAYLLVENDDYNGNLNSYILRSLTAGVTYYIGAGAYNNGAATYTLTIAGSSAAATYTVSYNANGGSGAPASQTKTQNVSLTLSSVRPTRSGYNFLGWSTSSAATSASYQPGTAFTVNANTTLYAVWQASTVTITWNTNGASIPPVNVVKTPGTAIGTLPVPARTNYTFAGWFTAASGGTQITASSAVPAVNTIYYARWISSVTITWNANGGSGVSSQTKTVGNAMGTLPTTVRTGYTLNGWYTASSGGTKISASTAVPTGNATYYAQWAIKYVTVTWNANGGSVSPTSASKQEGTALGTLPTPTRTGYTFNGWYTASSGGTKISTSTIVPSSSVTYYAQWTAKTVTITWNANGGSVSPTSAVKQVGTTLGTLPTPTRTGYTFNGWYTSSSGGTKISVSTAVPSSNIIYYAQWAVKYVTVTWNANGGNVSSTSASKQEGTVLGTLPTPTRTGYTFNGWYTASSGGTKISGNTVTTSNVTYYAQWTAKTVTITWNAGNGSVSVTSSVKTAGTALGTLPISTVPNLKLDGWYTSSTGGTKISSSTLAPSTNTTYYARWDLSAENIMINLLTEQLKAKLSSAAKHITNPVRLKDVERGVIASVLRNAIDSAVVPTALLLDIIESIPKTYFSAEFYKAHMNNSAKIIESLANQSTYKDSFYVGMTIGDVAIMAVGVGATAKGITAIIEGIFVGVGGTVGSGLLGGVIAIPAGVALSVEGSITLGVGAVVFLTAADKFWNDIGMADNSSNGPFIGDEDGIPPGSEVKWPDNDGLDGTPWNHPFKKGETFGRYNLPGYERGGKFAAKTGTPFSERSLPHPKSSYDYHEYEVLRPFNSEAGYTAPWFGRKGGGLQYKLPLDIDMLIDQQYIKKLF